MRFASSMADEFYWFRGGPFAFACFMARDRNTVTFSVFTKMLMELTFSEEDGLSRVIDGRMKFCISGYAK